MRSEKNGAPSKVDQTLEAVSADFFWVPDDVHVVERDAVTYTYSDRSAEIYNCVPRVRPESCDVDSLVTEVVDRHRGSSSKWYITPMSDDPALLDALKTAGYDADRHFHAYAVEAAEYDRDVPADIEVRQVRSVSDLQMWYEISENVTGDSPELSDEDLAREVDECTGRNRRVTRFVAYHRGEPAGCAGLNFFEDHSFGLLWGGGVRPEHRNRGAYTSLLQARAELAAEWGIRHIGLYARDETSAPIVDAHGFERHGPMTFWSRDMRE